jgi:hypothetical protein
MPSSLSLLSVPYFYVALAWILAPFFVFFLSGRQWFGIKSRVARLNEQASLPIQAT